MNDEAARARRFGSKVCNSSRSILQERKGVWEFTVLIMHSLLKPEFPRLSSLSSISVRIKEKQWRLYSRLGEQISFL